MEELMPESDERLAVPLATVYQRNPTPGALGVLTPGDRLKELEQHQEERVLRDWEVRGVVSDHIPLAGLGAITAAPQHRLFLSRSPLSLWLHRGGNRAVHFDLVSETPEQKLDYIAVKVRTSFQVTLSSWLANR
jgi:hypothetical protein